MPAASPAPAFWLSAVSLAALNRKTKSLAKANSELKNFNELRKTFIDADGSIVFLKDENLKYVFVNQALQEFLQRPSDEIVGKDDFALLDPAYAQIFTDSDLNALAENKVVTDTGTWNDRFYRTTNSRAHAQRQIRRRRIYDRHNRGPQPSGQPGADAEAKQTAAGCFGQQLQK